MAVKWRFDARKRAIRLRFSRTIDEVAPYGEEDGHGDDLTHETCNHNPDSKVPTIVLIGRRCHATTKCLQYEREEISAHEDVSIHLGSNARVFGTDSCDHTAKTKIDSARE